MELRKNTSLNSNTHLQNVGSVSEGPVINPILILSLPTWHTPIQKKNQADIKNDQTCPHPAPATAFCIYLMLLLLDNRPDPILDSYSSIRSSKPSLNIPLTLKMFQDPLSNICNLVPHITSPQRRSCCILGSGQVNFVSTSSIYNYFSQDFV